MGGIVAQGTFIVNWENALESSGRMIKAPAILIHPMSGTVEAAKREVLGMVLDQQVPTRLEGDTVAIYIDLTAQVNPTGLRKRSLRFETMRAV